MRVLARIQTAIYTNKIVAFFTSILLVSLIYFTSLNQQSSSSPYVTKRHGLGAGDTTTGELRTALKRKGDGRAAVAIIRVIGASASGGADKTTKKDSNPHLDVQYLMQLKSHDYPITAFRGTVCLLGGNANKHDETPLDTLKRELNEELQYPEWVDKIDPLNIIDDSAIQLSPNKSFKNATLVPPIPGTVRYLGSTLHFQSSELIEKKVPYAFLCALYEITLTPDQLPPNVLYPRGANIQEGRVVLLTEDQLVKHSKYAWGYEYTMEKYFGKKTLNKQRGTAVSDVDEKTWRETVWTPAK